MFQGLLYSKDLVRKWRHTWFCLKLEVILSVSYDFPMVSICFHGFPMVLPWFSRLFRSFGFEPHQVFMAHGASPPDIPTGTKATRVELRGHIPGIAVADDGCWKLSVLREQPRRRSMYIETV